MPGMGVYYSPYEQVLMGATKIFLYCLSNNMYRVYRMYRAQFGTVSLAFSRYAPRYAPDKGVPARSTLGRRVRVWRGQILSPGTRGRW